MTQRQQVPKDGFVYFPSNACCLPLSKKQSFIYEFFVISTIMSTDTKGYGWRVSRGYDLPRECAKCEHKGSNKNPLTIHHIKPTSEGGANTRENMSVLCKKHHAELHNTYDTGTQTYWKAFLSGALISEWRFLYEAYEKQEKEDGK